MSAPVRIEPIASGSRLAKDQTCLRGVLHTRTRQPSTTSTVPSTTQQACSGGSSRTQLGQDAVVLIAQHQFEQPAIALLEPLAPIAAFPIGTAETFDFLQEAAIEFVRAMLDLLDEIAFEQAE